MRYALSDEYVAKGKPFLRNQRFQANASVFLSHSHNDADLVLATINLLASAGVTVYVDWQDGEMPASPSPDTARKIKGAIERNAKFLLLLTGNSCRSTWVPWELGFCDGRKEARNIALLPVLGTGAGVEGNEYLGLYHVLQEGLSDWVLRSPEAGELTLRAWLSR
jgi:hypothetical protein